MSPGVPASEASAAAIGPRAWRAILVPSHFGAPVPGTHEGPRHVAARLALERSRRVAGIERVAVPGGGGAVVKDGIKDLARVRQVCRGLRDAVAGCLGRGERPLVLHGDDSAVIGVGYGLSAGFGRRFGLVYFDAHGDVNTPETSASGCLYGMGVAHLLGRGHPAILELHEGPPALLPGALCYVGARRLDPGEKRLLARERVPVIGVEAVRRDPASTVDAVTRRLLASGVREIWVHVDQDVVDPGESGATLCPEPGGLRAAELLEVLGGLWARFEPLAVSLGNYLPAADARGRTLAVIRQVLDSLWRLA